MVELSGKVVLITGASRGIGAEAARRFAQAGAHLGLMARDRDAVADIAAETGGTALAGDVAQADALEAAVSALVERFGRVDVLINNAGLIDPIGALEDCDPQAWGQAIDVNLKGVFHGIRAVLPIMRAQGGGTVLTVGSGAAHAPQQGWSAYCASKAGALMLTRALHLEAADAGIRAISLSPGTVATDMQARIRDSGINPVSRLDWSAHIPADWPARALLWLCGPGGDAYLGQEASLRDEGLRARIGLTAQP